MCEAAAAHFCLKTLLNFSSVVQFVGKKKPQDSSCIQWSYLMNKQHNLNKKIWIHFIKDNKVEVMNKNNYKNPLIRDEM